MQYAMLSPFCSDVLETVCNNFQGSFHNKHFLLRYYKNPWTEEFVCLHLERDFVQIVSTILNWKPN